MQDMDYEVVPALAKAVEARMEELKLTPTDLKRATGLSYTVLDHVRKGYRKKYAKGLKWAVCDALRWSNDSIDRILAGKKPLVLVVATDDDALAAPRMAADVVVKRLLAVEESVRRLDDQGVRIEAALAGIQRLLPSTRTESQPPEH